MNKAERAKLKAERRAEQARKGRIAEIQAGNVQAPAEYKDSLAARKKATKAAPESTFGAETLKKYEENIAKGNRKISKM